MDLTDPQASPKAPPSPPPALPREVLHGAVLRPPTLAWDGSRYRGDLLESMDLAHAQALPGVVAAVRIQHYVGLAAVSPILARQAADSLQLRWHRPDPTLQQAAQARRPPTPATAADDTRYIWSPGTAGAAVSGEAVAWCLQRTATVWLPLASEHLDPCRRELARLLQWDEHQIVMVSTEPAGTAADVLSAVDAAADAALLSRATGRPVRVALHAGSRPPVRLELALPVCPPFTDGADGTPGAPPVSSGSAGDGEAESVAPGTAPPRAGPPVLQAEAPWAVRPSLARLLSQPAQATPQAEAAPAELVAIRRTAAAGAAPLNHADSTHLLAAQVFAQESLVDEHSRRHGQDPVAYRLERLASEPARRLVRDVAARADWQPAGGFAGNTQALSTQTRPDTRLRGRGFAYAQAPEAGGTAWSAWVAEVAIDPASGQIDVTRVVVGHDSQSLSPARSAPIDDAHLLAQARQLLAAPARFDDWGALPPKSAGGSAQASTAIAPAVNPSDLPVPTAEPDAGRPAVDQGRLALDGVLTLPAAAAVANAIYDATGVRLRQAPFDAERLRLALQAPPAVRGRGASSAAWFRKTWGWLAAGATAAAGLAAMAWPVKAPIAPTAGPDVSLYSAAAIERGRLVAAAGDCIVCHTAAGGEANAGGLGLDTPFGTIYSTNITPDNDTGIGRWSYSAFERAMREGVHQDGRQLYPAFPYTAFAKMSDADMQALYGYLMSQPAVRAEPPRTELAFPYNLRPTLAGWNMLFHDNTPYRPDPTQSLEWNRGAYLVQGAGHCGACHTPRNSLGAEKTGTANFLAGGSAEGWNAPALNRLAEGPRPWTAEALYQYMRTGFSTRHGVAAGPMAPVIHGLAELPEQDVRAISTYLMALSPDSSAQTASADARAPTPTPAVPATLAPQALAALPADTAAAVRTPAADTTATPVYAAHVNGERLYQNACAACHEAGQGPTLFGVKPSLALNTNVHSTQPDNLVQVILHGIQDPANGELGYMPGFQDSLDDSQIADLLGYLRARFAPDQPAWTDRAAAVARVRQGHAP